MAGFQHFSISHISCEENTYTNTLSRLATLLDSSLGHAYIEYLQAPSYEVSGEVQQVTPELSWMAHYIRYIIDGTLLENRVEAGLLKKKAACFVLMDGQLY